MPSLTSDQKYQLVLDISHKVRDTLDLDSILGHILDTVKTVLDYDAAGIFVLNQELVHGRSETPAQMIAGVSRRGYDAGPDDKDAMLMYGDGITGHVIRTRECVIVPDVRRDPRYVMGRRQSRSEIAVPITLNERAIGALNVESDRLSAFAADDLEILQFFADFSAISIQKAMLHRQLLEQELIGKQLETARAVQSRLFPSRSPSLKGYDIAGVCIPTDEIGGDYFDYLPLSRRRLGLVVADVSGHGIPAALVMTAFRALLRTKARSNREPAAMAGTINRMLPEFTGEDHFVTALYAILDPSAGSLSYINCGHVPALLLRANGQAEMLEQKNIALGILKNPRFTAQQVLLEAGDVLLLYTDGAVDLMDQHGETFGLERLIGAVRENRHLPAAGLIDQVLKAARWFSRHCCSQDDLTLVVVKRKLDGLS